MIGVIPKPAELPAVEEFFQLFKTPWELFRCGRSYDVVIVTGDEIPEVDCPLLIIYGSGVRQSDVQAKSGPASGVQGALLEYANTQLPIYGGVLTFERASNAFLSLTSNLATVGFASDSSRPAQLRIGYDLFQEVARLLSAGQPTENARIPTLELHINLLRDCILKAGLPLLEIPPVPAGHPYFVCLTHDIDFVAVRKHKFDHTMWGFLYRATVGAAFNFLRGRTSIIRLLRSWWAALLLPLVHLGWAKDFWLMFDWYLRVERNLPSTYFLIPFMNRAGERVRARNPERRAAPYEAAELSEWIARWAEAGCETGVHGIDAWHSVDKGRAELAQVSRITGAPLHGIRMHWLLHDESTFRILEQAGYAYDSTSGYNETVGFRNGTTQTFRPPNVHRLLELPLHIQDGALFYPKSLDLSEAEARAICIELMEKTRRFGGVLTILWHDRSPGPERFWGEFYERLVQDLKSASVYFGSAGQIVNWFKSRREVTFQCDPTDSRTVRVALGSGLQPVAPSLTLRVHRAPRDGDPPWSRAVDHAWTGESDFVFEGEQLGAVNSRTPSAALEPLAVS